MLGEIKTRGETITQPFFSSASQDLLELHNISCTTLTPIKFVCCTYLNKAEWDKWFILIDVDFFVILNLIAATQMKTSWDSANDWEVRNVPKHLIGSFHK